MNCVFVLMAVLLVEIVSLLGEDAAKKVDDFSPELNRVKRAEGKSSFTYEEKIALLKRHNELRRIPNSSNMLFMYWDHTLETVAQNWANKCIFKHNPQRKTIQKKFPTVGENIFYTTGSIAGNTHIFVNDWYNEVKYYTYKRNSCTKGEQCGHYTQIVWHKSSLIGCGVKFCKIAQVYSNPKKHNVMIVVCNYAPAGNFVGQNPYSKGKACNYCPSKKPVCFDGLCGVKNCGGKTCKNGGKLVSEFCFCNCKDTGHTGDTCEIAPASKVASGSESGRVLANSYPLMIAAAFYLFNIF